MGVLKSATPISNGRDTTSYSTQHGNQNKAYAKPKRILHVIYTWPDLNNKTAQCTESQTESTSRLHHLVPRDERIPKLEADFFCDFFLFVFSVGIFANFGPIFPGLARENRIFKNLGGSI
eukprot:SAG11_NODE_1164_length_5623_cov_18.626358_8_plen_120_part_00